MKRGKFITLEGVDGAGKSSHVEWLGDRLRSQGIDVLVTREPGGTALGERLRDIILAEPMSLDTEALLIFAARSEHIARVIGPALEAGRWVLSDRFTDATFAYQGGGRGMPVARIGSLEDWVQQGLQPDLTLFFDVPLDVARSRLLANAAALDRFEQENVEFFGRVRAAYLARVAANPVRFRKIDSSQPKEDIRVILEKIVSDICLK